MTQWIALSDSPAPAPASAPGVLLDRGTLVLEIDLPLTEPTVLLDYQRDDGWARTMSLFFDPVAGLTFLHRQGPSLTRHVLPGPVQRTAGAARIGFFWDAPARQWDMALEMPQDEPPLFARGSNPLPVPLADITALCGGTGLRRRHPALRWLGVARGRVAIEHAPWIGLRTPITTMQGPVAAGLLQPGDRIQTRDSGWVPVLSIRRMELPNRGSFAPILLRAPYFGAATDLLVSADQLVGVSGVAVEYLFGEDEVLATAGSLIDGVTAIRDLRRAVTACVSLDLGGAELIMADGCTLLSAHHGPRGILPALPRRLLHRYEAMPLLSQLGRSAHGAVA